MKNIESARKTILENLNIGQILENFKPLSMKGSSTKSQLVTLFNNGRLNNLSAITDMIVECHNMMHVDQNAYEISETLSEKLTNDIIAKLVFCHEDLSSKPTNVIIENALNVIDTLVTLNEDQIVNSIRTGALNAFRNFNSVQFVIESCKIVTENSAESNQHVAYRPVSYVETINENTFIRLGNNVLLLNNSNVFVTKSPSPKFNFMSSIVEQMKYDQVNEQFSVEHDSLGQFIVSESAISRKSAQDKEFEQYTPQALVEAMSLIVESKGFTSVNRREINEQQQFVDALVALYENFDKVAILDQCIIVENKLTNEKFTMLVHENTPYVGVLKSTRFPNVVEKFANVVEALNKLKKRSGYDAKHFFVKDIVIFETLSETTTKQVEALQSVVEALDVKRKEVVKLINEERNGEIRVPEKAKLLAETLQTIDAMIVEQETAIAEIAKLV